MASLGRELSGDASGLADEGRFEEVAQCRTRFDQLPESRRERPGAEDGFVPGPEGTRVCAEDFNERGIVGPVSGRFQRRRLDLGVSVEQHLLFGREVAEDGLSRHVGARATSSTVTDSNPV
jgi:hypothetical protein